MRPISIFPGRPSCRSSDRYENLVILRTLSKVGFAAMRIGLLIGPPALVHELDKVRLPYNLNALSQAAAGFYLDQEEAFLKQAEEILPLAGRALSRRYGSRPGNPIPGRRMQILFFLIAISMRIAYIAN